MKENAKEGREEAHEPRPLSDPDEPGGLKDGATDRHAAPNLLQESDPQTQPSPISPCPPSPAEAEHLKQQCSYPTPPEAGPASVKRTKDVPKSPERKRKVALPPNVWKFTIITIATNNIIDYVDLKNILLFLKDNYLNTTQKIFSLKDENRIFGNVKNRFCVMLDKKKDFINIIRKHAYRQHALVFFLKKGVSHSEFIIAIKGPYYPKCKGKVHSEDLIIEEIELFLKENDDVSEIWIYTLNSPCLARENHCPCMYNLIKFSERYPDIQIYIGFSKHYIFTPKINNFCEKAGKQITFNSQFCFTFKDLDSKETCKVQNEKGAETSAELLSTPREKIKERNEDIDGIKSENDERVGLSEEEQLQYNQNVVLTFLNKLQGRYSNLNFFHLPFEEYLNFGSSDNLAHLTNEE